MSDDIPAILGVVSFQLLEMLPTVIRDLIRSYHEPWPFYHSRLVYEFKELVAGRPWTTFSMLWVDWWDD